MNGIETTFEEIIRWLQSTRYISSEQASGLLNADQSATSLPTEKNIDRAWYVKFFIGLSAWIAALFLITGIAGLAFVSNGPTMTIAGAVILIAALSLKWMLRQSIFWGQFSFALSLTGQGLLLGGIIQIVTNDFRGFEPNSVSLIAAIVLIIEFVLFFIYPDSIHRLLSVIFGSLAGMFLLADLAVGLDDLEPEHLLSLPPLLLSLFSVGMVLIWQSRTSFLASRWHELFAPLAYGFAIMALGLTLVALIPVNEFNRGGEQALYSMWWMASVGLALLLAHLAMQVIDESAGEFAQPRLAKLGLIIAIGLLIIPLYNTAGIWAALLALVLGFRQNSRLLLGLASLFLLFFIGFYYYSLDITLLNKSYALIGSGLLLLLIRFAGGRLLGRGTHRQPIPTIASGTGEYSA